LFFFVRAAVRDNKTNVLRTSLQTRVDFPFEVDLWSLGVTLYQCATGLEFFFFSTEQYFFHFILFKVNFHFNHLLVHEKIELV
jgi:serine/threonine protein kinase